jgi:hypothetical protein
MTVESSQGTQFDVPSVNYARILSRYLALASSDKALHICLMVFSGNFHDVGTFPHPAEFG